MKFNPFVPPASAPQAVATSVTAGNPQVASAPQEPADSAPKRTPFNWTFAPPSQAVILQQEASPQATAAHRAKKDGFTAMQDLYLAQLSRGTSEWGGRTTQFRKYFRNADGDGPDNATVRLRFKGFWAPKDDGKVDRTLHEIWGWPPGAVGAVTSGRVMSRAAALSRRRQSRNAWRALPRP